MASIQEQRRNPLMNTCEECSHEFSGITCTNCGLVVVDIISTQLDRALIVPTSDDITDHLIMSGAPQRRPKSQKKPSSTMRNLRRLKRLAEQFTGGEIDPETFSKTGRLSDLVLKLEIQARNSPNFAKIVHNKEGKMTFADFHSCFLSLRIFCRKLGIRLNWTEIIEDIFRRDSPESPPVPNGAPDGC